MEDRTGTNQLIIDDENGRLVRSKGDRTKNLADVLGLLMGDENRRLALQPDVEQMVEKHKLSTITNEWLALCHSVAS